MWRWTLGQHWKLLIYAVALMACFNFFSHGTQDNYATFLEVQHGFKPQTVGLLTAIMNLGAIAGGPQLRRLVGADRAAARPSPSRAVLALPIIPLWAFAPTPILLGLGGFLMQIAVQGAWGVVPVHLNELSPTNARGTFPGAAYQFGNLIAAYAVPDAGEAGRSPADRAAGTPNYGLALALVAAATAVVLALLTWFGPEAKGKSFRGSILPRQEEDLGFAAPQPRFQPGLVQVAADEGPCGCSDAHRPSRGAAGRPP